MGESDEAGRGAEAAAVPLGTNDEGRRSWLSGPRVVVGVFALAALGGGAWWRRRQRKRIALQPMSEDWLREREYGAGQRPSQE
jgi:MYXO-CTERM domain-containing protein